MAKYQYETSPRKTKPEYTKPNNVDINQKQNKKVKTKNKTLKKVKIVLYVICAFALFFTVSYRNAIIDIKYAEIKELKSELALIQKENEQLEANAEQKLNLKKVQEVAQDKLGMKILSTDQIEYINLSKTDHIESSTVETEEENYMDKIIKFIKNLIK